MGRVQVSALLLVLLGAAAQKRRAASAPPASPPSPKPRVDKSAEPGEHPLVAFGPQPVSNDAEFGLLIDAGSTGSRLHVYEWPKRVFSTLPPPITHPLTSELWTKRRAPGISSLADDPKAAAETLLPLIEHAKVLLRHYQKDWHRFPIWVKATAGMRVLAHTPRRAIIEEVRALLLSDKNPFHFVEADAARVISGEEEAGYAWTGINFALGHLLEDGTGSGTARPTRAVGIVEMGGASSQLSFINPGHDIIENLFKVQVGGLKHWNIYARSFLHYGAYSAMQRVWNELAMEQRCFDMDADFSMPCVLHDPCVPVGMPPMPLPPTVTNQSGVVPPSTFGPLRAAILVPAPDAPGVPRFERCYEQLVAKGSSLGLQGNDKFPFAGYVEGATRRRFNEWCDWAHHGQCAMADVYLPLLPDATDVFGNFHLLGSSLVETFQSLGVPQRASLTNLTRVATAACGLHMHHLVKFVHKHASASDYSMSDDGFVPDFDLPDDVDDAAGPDEGADARAAAAAGLDAVGDAQSGHGLRAVSHELQEAMLEAAEESSDEKSAREICFKAALTVAMLNNGFGVHMDRPLQATDVIETKAGNKLKAGWTLGAILFEINSLPWSYKPDANSPTGAPAAGGVQLTPHPPITVGQSGVATSGVATSTAPAADAQGAHATARSAVGAQRVDAADALDGPRGGRDGVYDLQEDAVVLGGMLLGVSSAFALVLAAVFAGVARLRARGQCGAAASDDDEGGEAARDTPLLRVEPERAQRRPYEHLLPAHQRIAAVRD